MANCPKCGAYYEGHPEHCPGCGVKFVFKPSQALMYKKTGGTPHQYNRCPNCGVYFIGLKEHCPNCHATLSYKIVSAIPYKAPNAQQTKPQLPQKVNASNLPSKVEVKKETKEMNPFKVLPLRTRRSCIKFFFLNLITLGIYAFVYFHKYGVDLNRIRIHYKALPRFGYIPSFFLSLVTLGIPLLLFYIRRTKDTYKYARKEGVACGSSVFWYLSFFIVLSWTIVCPIIASFQLVRTMNNLCKTLNEK